MLNSAETASECGRPQALHTNAVLAVIYYAGFRLFVQQWFYVQSPEDEISLACSPCLPLPFAGLGGFDSPVGPNSFTCILLGGRSAEYWSALLTCVPRTKTGPEPSVETSEPEKETSQFLLTS